MVGLAPEDAVGRTIRELSPSVEESWSESFALVVETGQSLTFTDQVGRIGRWYEGRAHKLIGESFVVLFQEITDRVWAERAQHAALASCCTSWRPTRPSMDP